jgi:aminoglycoside phosphotransferase (APT) family kinase protein
VDLEHEEDWRRLIGSYGPEAEVLGYLGGGPRGAVREVRVDSRRGVGRLSNRSRASIDWEVYVLGFLAESGLRVPEVIATASGSRRAEHLVVTEFISGRAPVDEDDRRRARYLTRLHELTADSDQRPGFRTARELVTLNSSGDIDLTAMPDDVVEVCRAAWTALPPGPLAVVHGDPRPDNWLVAYDGDPVLVDWDEARVDHPWLDLGALPPQATGLTEKQAHIARLAWCAYDVAAQWQRDNEYARRRLRLLIRLGG